MKNQAILFILSIHGSAGVRHRILVSGRSPVVESAWGGDATL